MITRDHAYSALMERLGEMTIIDSHEHLPPEKERLATEWDFSLLFSHYCWGDLISAGMPFITMERFRDPAMPLDEKWSLFEPYYQRIQDGSYCRAAHLAMRKFYDIECLTSLSDAETLTAAIRQANVPGLYQRVLKDTCHIEKSMNYGSLDDDPAFFAPVLYMSGYAEVSKTLIRDLEDRHGISCATLNGYVEAVEREMYDFKARGAKGCKFPFAYSRDLYFAPRTHEEAERVFLRVLEEGYGSRTAALGYGECRPLQDYMVHRIAEFAGKLEMPVVFHTALQANIDHKADDARPNRLWNLPHRYRKTDFILLHAGLPWMEDAALLAKHYPNVYLDMGWDHLMSPELSTRALKAFIDLVPMHKIFGFGGDYLVVEKVYGHLVLAKQNIARALAEKMETDGMPMARAETWLQALMYDNPSRVFRLAK